MQGLDDIVDLVGDPSLTGKVCVSPVAWTTSFLTALLPGRVSGFSVGGWAG